MSYNSLRDFIKILKKEDELITVDKPVNTELEITEIIDRISKSEGGGKAVLFTDNGTDFPILINMFGSHKRMALSLGINSISEIQQEMNSLFEEITKERLSFTDKLKVLPQLGKIASWLPKKISKKGACQQVIMDEPDLSKLPILKCWPHDGGKFITLPMVFTEDPTSGNRNVGMYRMQILDNKTTGMHWHRHKTGANHFAKYKELGIKMPISVALGGDPAYTYSATAPMPENIDEMMLAGFLRKKKVQMVKCITNDIWVPEDADFVIEGYVDPHEDFVLEGPFGDHTGFYSLADYYPKFHLTAITHRKDAVYPTTIVGVPPQEDAYIGTATEQIFLTPIRMTMVQEIVDMYLPFYGVAHNLCIVKIKKSYPGQAQKVMSTLWGAGQMMFNKIIVVIDENIDIRDDKALLNHLMESVKIDRDLIFSTGPLDVLDHTAPHFSYGSKLGIDATTKLKEEIDVINLHAKHETAESEELNTVQELKVSEENVAFIKIDSEKVKNIDKAISCAINKYKDRYSIVVMFDKAVPIEDTFSALWVLMGNIDPKRDIYFSDKMIVIDATSKKQESHNFKRQWPNVVISDSKTIEKIDERWDELNLGDFVVSPSKKYTEMMRNDGAVAFGDELC
ncbi:MAG: menaquinone biosynthesis decarboxylase [Bacteroidales bacterium]